MVKLFKRGLTARGLWFCALLALLLVVFFVVALQRYQDRLLAVVLSSQQVELAEASDQLIADLRARTADLNLLTNLPELAQPNDYSSPGSAPMLQRVSEYFSRFLQAYPEYDQVRLLDVSGREQINIKREMGAVRTIPAHQRQDKSERYYVKEALAQPHSATYLSRIDLNREFGEVQRPFKPTVRMVRAVEVLADDGTGTPQINGLVVANLAVAELLERYRRALKNLWQADVFIIDERGYFIVHPTTDLQWGFDLGAPSNRLELFFPEVWRQLQGGQVVVELPAQQSVPWRLKGYQRGGHFISHSFQLPGVASGAGDLDGSAHRYRALMFIANQSLEPWSLRYHWVWWAFLVFLLGLVGAALAAGYRAYRWQQKYSTIECKLGDCRQQLEQHQQRELAAAGWQAEIRARLRDIRNHAASIVGFAGLLKEHRHNDQSQRINSLEIIEQAAEQLLDSVDQAQHRLAEQRGEMMTENSE